MTESERIGIQCPKCGRKTKERARKIGTGYQFVCPSCGFEEKLEGFSVSEQLLRAKREARRALKPRED
jgi:ssDNA-binding Zn-finger/Zn-ribbon topoisomerase 1